MQLVHTVVADCEALVVLKSMAGWRSFGFHFRPILASWLCQTFLQLCFGGLVVAGVLQVSSACARQLASCQNTTAGCALE